MPRRLSPSGGVLLFPEQDSADAEATHALFRTAPATAAGAAAVLRYVMECDAQGDEILTAFMTDARADDPTVVLGRQAFMASLAAGLEKLAAAA